MAVGMHLNGKNAGSRSNTECRETKIITPRIAVKKKLGFASNW